MRNFIKYNGIRLTPSLNNGMLEAIETIEKKHNVKLTRAEYIRLCIDNTNREIKGDKAGIKSNFMLKINRYI